MVIVFRCGAVFLLLCGAVFFLGGVIFLVFLWCCFCRVVLFCVVLFLSWCFVVGCWLLVGCCGYVNQLLFWSFLVSKEYFLAFYAQVREEQQVISLQFVGSQQDVSNCRKKKRKQVDDVTAIALDLDDFLLKTR